MENVNNPENWKFNYYKGYNYLSAGICCGLTSLAAGLCIGIVGDAGVRSVAQREEVYMALILMMIFSEALALYGFIIAVILSAGG